MNVLRWIGLAVVIGLLVGTGASMARAAPVLTCPESVKAAAGLGWVRPAKPPQAGAGAWALFEGPPAELASLAPDSDSGTAQIFLLDQNAVHWAQCRVGTGPVLELRLPAGLQRCEVGYKRLSPRAVRFDRTMSCS